MKAKYIIGSVIIVLFGVWGASAFLKTTVKYVTFAEAKATGNIVQVSGRVDFSQVRYDAEGKRLEFVMIEPDSLHTGVENRMKVIYQGIIPGNFEQATSVMVRGRVHGEEFVAEKLYVKCPSKYQAQMDQSG
jgi:cytochrome c-type biogenesis protein CcmE